MGIFLVFWGFYVCLFDCFCFVFFFISIPIQVQAMMGNPGDAPRAGSHFAPGNPTPKCRAITSNSLNFPPVSSDIPESRNVPRDDGTLDRTSKALCSLLDPLSVPFVSPNSKIPSWSPRRAGCSSSRRSKSVFFFRDSSFSRIYFHPGMALTLPKPAPGDPKAADFPKWCNPSAGATMGSFTGLKTSLKRLKRMKGNREEKGFGGGKCSFHSLAVQPFPK